MEDPVTQAALEHVTGLLEAAEAELAITKRDLEITKRELQWHKDALHANRQQQQAQQRIYSTVRGPNTVGGLPDWASTWNGGNVANGIVDESQRLAEANLFDEAKMRKALGIPENARLPQDHRPKKSK